MNCGSPGTEWCSKCEDENPGCGPDGADMYAQQVVRLEEFCELCGQIVDAHCNCSNGRLKAERLAKQYDATLPPNCDCRNPAPVEGTQEKYGAWQGLECAGCRGKVSLARILSEDITRRKP